MDYLINNLSDGRKLNVTLISHNAIWTQLKRLSRRYENFEVNVFGHVENLEMRGDSDYRNIEESDLIIFYSSDNYSEYDLNYLKNVAVDISNNCNKRVTIGYSSFIDKRQHIDIISTKDEKTNDFSVVSDEFWKVDRLASETLFTHDEFELKKKINL